MRNPMLLMWLVVSLGVTHSAVAEPAGLTDKPMLLAAQNLVPSKPSRATRLPPRSQRLDSRDAAAQVREQFQSHKILSVSLIDSKGPVVYRVKTLSPDGVVKTVFVDGNTGNVFE
jgi:uncharacterized membrane protein YkoI